MYNLVLEKVKKQFNEGRIAFSTNDAEGTGHSQAKKERKKKKRSKPHILCKKLIQMDHRLKCETIENSKYIELGLEFSDFTPKARPIKENLINWTSSKLKAFVL